MEFKLITTLTDNLCCSALKVTGKGFFFVQRFFQSSKNVIIYIPFQTFFFILLFKRRRVAPGEPDSRVNAFYAIFYKIESLPFIFRNKKRRCL